MKCLDLNIISMKAIISKMLRQMFWNTWRILSLLVDFDLDLLFNYFMYFRANIINSIHFVTVQDTVLRIWVLKSAYNYFKDMRNRYNADVKSSPTNSYETVISDQIESEDKSHQIFVDSPFCTYTGSNRFYHQIWDIKISISN